MTISEALGSVFAVRDTRLGQMGDMLQLTGALTVLEEGSCTEVGLEHAVVRCLNCECPDICRVWLTKAETDAAAPPFCPNTAQFNALKAL